MRPVNTQAIEDALARLAADPRGRKLSATRLAAEAGVSRSTIYRSPELLRRLRNLDEDRMHEMETQVAALKDRISNELRKLWTENRHMAQRIQTLSQHVQDLQRTITRLRAAAEA